MKLIAYTQFAMICFFATHLGATQINPYEPPQDTLKNSNSYERLCGQIFSSTKASDRILSILGAPPTKTEQQIKNITAILARHENTYTIMTAAFYFASIQMLLVDVSKLTSEQKDAFTRLGLMQANSFSDWLYTLFDHLRSRLWQTPELSTGVLVRLRSMLARCERTYKTECSKYYRALVDVGSEWLPGPFDYHRYMQTIVFLPNEMQVLEIKTFLEDVGFFELTPPSRF